MVVRDGDAASAVGVLDSEIVERALVDGKVADGVRDDTNDAVLCSEALASPVGDTEIDDRGEAVLSILSEFVCDSVAVIESVAVSVSDAVGSDDGDASDV